MFRETKLTVTKAMETCRIAKISDQKLQQIGNKSGKMYTSQKGGFIRSNFQRKSSPGNGQRKL